MGQVWPPGALPGGRLKAFLELRRGLGNLFGHGWPCWAARRRPAAPTGVQIPGGGSGRVALAP
eukprot:7629222-Pyramimonas_sp.AAC.1